jgi:hypothetical protein
MTARLLNVAGDVIADVELPTEDRPTVLIFNLRAYAYQHTVWPPGGDPPQATYREASLAYVTATGVTTPDRRRGPDRRKARMDTFFATAYTRPPVLSALSEAEGSAVEGPEPAKKED